MSELKKISIDPAHFQYSASKDTRKKRPKNGIGNGEDGSTVGSGTSPIRVRGPPKDHNKTTKRNALLKFIRRHQSDNYQRLMEHGGSSGEPSNAPPRLSPKSEIDDTLDYLMNVADEVRQKEIARNGTSQTHQHTLKRHIPTHEYVSTEFPSGVMQTRVQPSNIHLNPRPPVPPPQYGILKGGNMPTYREWRQKPDLGTGLGHRPDHIHGLDHRPDHIHGLGVSNMNGSNREGSLIPSSVMQPPNLSPIHSSYQVDANANANSGMKSWLTENHEDYVLGQRARSLQQLTMESTFGAHSGLGKGGSVSKVVGSSDASKVRLKIMRQRRTSRRTFKVGKSKTHPKVGVLISNRTIRKTVSTQALHLKQTPIAEVKRYLVKHGLIRVGTASPDYMLRKLYESVQMVPGEIHNHNVDNLLYNFMNSPSEK